MPSAPCSGVRFPAPCPLLPPPRPRPAAGPEARSGPCNRCCKTGAVPPRTADRRPPRNPPRLRSTRVGRPRRVGLAEDGRGGVGARRLHPVEAALDAVEGPILFVVVVAVGLERAHDGVADEEADADRADGEGKRVALVLLAPVERVADRLANLLVLVDHCVFYLRDRLRNGFARLFHATLKLRLGRVRVVGRFGRARGP